MHSANSFTSHSIQLARRLNQPAPSYESILPVRQKLALKFILN